MKPRNKTYRFTSKEHACVAQFMPTAWYLTTLQLEGPRVVANYIYRYSSGDPESLIKTWQGKKVENALDTLLAIPHDKI